MQSVGENFKATAVHVSLPTMIEVATTDRVLDLDKSQLGKVTLIEGPSAVGKTTIIQQDLQRIGSLGDVELHSSLGPPIVVKRDSDDRTLVFYVAFRDGDYEVEMRKRFCLKPNDSINAVFEFLQRCGKRAVVVFDDVQNVMHNDLFFGKCMTTAEQSRDLVRFVFVASEGSIASTIKKYSRYNMRLVVSYSAGFSSETLQKYIKGDSLVYSKFGKSEAQIKKFMENLGTVGDLALFYQSGLTLDKFIAEALADSLVVVIELAGMNPPAPDFLETWIKVVQLLDHTMEMKPLGRLIRGHLQAIVDSNVIAIVRNSVVWKRKVFAKQRDEILAELIEVKERLYSRGSQSQ